MTRRAFRLVVDGEMGLAMREAFSDLNAHCEAGRTVLSGELSDQAALYSVLGRLQDLGLDLIDVSVEPADG